MTLKVITITILRTTTEIITLLSSISYVLSELTQLKWFEVFYSPGTVISF